MIVAATLRYLVSFTDRQGTRANLSTWIDEKSGKLTSDIIPDLDESGPLVDIGRSECCTKHKVLHDTLGSEFDAAITSEFVRSKETASEVAGLGHKQHVFGSSTFSDPNGITHIVLEVSNPVE